MRLPGSDTPPLPPRRPYRGIAKVNGTFLIHPINSCGIVRP